MTCTHKNTDDQRCKILLFNGQPTEEDCASCMSYRGKDRGLGDRVARIINAVGFTHLGRDDVAAQPDLVVSGHCQSCGERRAKLNKRFPRKDH